jgi:hypothetical protein
MYKYYRFELCMKVSQFSGYLRFKCTSICTCVRNGVRVCVTLKVYTGIGVRNGVCFAHTLQWMEPIFSPSLNLNGDSTQYSVGNDGDENVSKYV